MKLGGVFSPNDPSWNTQEESPKLCSPRPFHGTRFHFCTGPPIYTLHFLTVVLSTFSIYKGQGGEVLSIRGRAGFYIKLYWNVDVFISTSWNSCDDVSWDTKFYCIPTWKKSFKINVIKVSYSKYANLIKNQNHNFLCCFKI